jgi:hypothetical protein
MIIGYFLITVILLLVLLCSGLYLKYKSKPVLFALAMAIVFLIITIGVTIDLFDSITLF